VVEVVACPVTATTKIRLKMSYVSMVIRDYNPNTQEAEGGSHIQGQPRLHNETLCSQKANRTRPPKKRAKCLNRHFLEKIHKWPVSTCKDVQCHSSLGKGK
jgi:hypothetical protein